MGAPTVMAWGDEAPAVSSWLRTAYGAPYRLPPPTVVFEVYWRPLGGSWWLRVLDGGGLPLRVPVDSTRAGFLAAIGDRPGEYHLLPIDAVSEQPVGAREPAWVRVDASAAVRAGEPA